MSSESITEHNTRRTNLWRLVIGFAAVLTLIVFLRLNGGWFDAESFLSSGAGRLTPLLIILTITVAWAFAIPVSAFLIVTPLLYPPLESSLITTCGFTLGAACAYGAACYFGSDKVDRWRDSRIKNFLTRHASFLTLFGLHLIPFFPHGLVNYTAGLTRTSFAKFLAATALAMWVKSYLYAELVHRTLGAKTLADAVNWRTLLSMLGIAALSFIGHFLQQRWFRSKRNASVDVASE